METKNTIDLQKFCASEDSFKYQMQKPWTRGDFTYATDGHVAVRVPIVAGIPEQTNAPAVDTLAWDTPVNPDQWISIPKLPKRKIVTAFKDCAYCGGSGKEHEDCDDCRHECEECDGEGRLEDGEKLDQKSVPIKVGSKFVSNLHLERIRDLPNPQLAPEATPETEAFPFRFDGGQGLVMPMRD